MVYAYILSIVLYIVTWEYLIITVRKLIMSDIGKQNFLKFIKERNTKINDNIIACVIVGLLPIINIIASVALFIFSNSIIQESFHQIKNEYNHFTKE